MQIVDGNPGQTLTWTGSDVNIGAGAHRGSQVLKMPEIAHLPSCVTCGFFSSKYRASLTSAAMRCMTLQACNGVVSDLVRPLTHPSSRSAVVPYVSGTIRGSVCQVVLTESVGCNINPSLSWFVICSFATSAYGTARYSRRASQSCFSLHLS